MANRTLAKDFHRLLKRIGRLTEEQASIDSVNWDDENLTNFHVTIRPNSGLYKGGRFKFTVNNLEDFQNGEIPKVWCDTDMFHPNIDNNMQKSEKNASNICLSLFDSDIWDKSHGLEGIVLGLLFLLHNPNLNDPLSRDFSSCCEWEDFAEGVKAYMTTGEVWGNSYNIDFRVIDGKSVDLNKDKTGEEQGKLSTEPTNVKESPVIDNITDIPVTNALLTMPIIDTTEGDGDEVEEDIKPVRFFKEEFNYDDDDGNESENEYFYIGFADEDVIKDNDFKMECDTSEIVTDRKEPADQQIRTDDIGHEQNAEDVNIAFAIDNPENIEHKETEFRENVDKEKMMVDSTDSNCKNNENQTNTHHPDSVIHENRLYEHTAAEMVVDISDSEIEERWRLGVRTRSLRSFDTVTEARLESLIRRSVSTPGCLFFNASRNPLRQGIVS